MSLKREREGRRRGFRGSSRSTPLPKMKVFSSKQQRNTGPKLPNYYRTNGNACQLFVCMLCVYDLWVIWSIVKWDQLMVLIALLISHRLFVAYHKWYWLVIHTINCGGSTNLVLFSPHLKVKLLLLLLMLCSSSCSPVWQQSIPWTIWKEKIHIDIFCNKLHRAHMKVFAKAMQ